MASGYQSLVILGILTCLLLVRVAMSESLFDMPLFEVGTLWLRATQNLTTQFTDSIFNYPDLSSAWTYVNILAVGMIAYVLYVIIMKPMNRVRTLGDLGYVCDSGLSMKEMANVVQKRKQSGNPPPVYPNGWFSVLESRDLKVGESKSVSYLGLHLAVFRGEDGRAHIIDAYCPHLGANLAVGGQVKGSCLECPFHGWRFNGDSGKCTHIPYADKIPDQAKVKSYTCLERNQFIHVWFDAEGREPYWEPEEIEQIAKGDWVYRGRTEHIVNAHIEEVPENGADVAHLTQVHSPFMTTGVDLRYTYSKFWSFIKHNWSGVWEPGKDENKHIGTLTLTHSAALFGKSIHLLNMSVEAKQVGPGLVYLYFQGVLGEGIYMQSLTPQEPMLQRMVHHVYMKWYLPPIIGKFFLLSEALQVERDIMIWNNKRYESKPLFVKSNEDSLLAKHRRWYSQFYSENSRRLTFKKDTLDW